MARMGDWRNNKDEEIELDGIGGVSIFVKADVHRSGKYSSPLLILLCWWSSSDICLPRRDQLPLLRIRKSSRDRRIRENGQTRRLSGGRIAQLCGLAH